MARIEVGQTAVSPTIARTLIAVFLVLIIVPLIIDWTVSARRPGGGGTGWSALFALPGDVRRTIAEQRASDKAGIISVILAANRIVLAGIHAFEDYLADESPVAATLRPPAQTILSDWLGVGNERVYQGRDGWLFFRPDVDFVIGPGFLDPGAMHRRRIASKEWTDQPQPDPRAALVGFRRQLEERGITLIVMPTPVKPAMHPERLVAARQWTTPVQNPSYRGFIDDLRREKIIVFDLADELARDGSNAYLMTDTHWRPESMERAAELLAAFIRTQVTFDDSLSPGESERQPPTHVESREVTNVGDTAAMLDLPAGNRLNRPESVTIRRVLESDGTPWRSSRTAEVLVLGDSFSNIYSLASMGWGDAAGLVEHLARILDRPIDRIVQNDNGSYATRARLRQDLAAGTDRLRGKRVVVLQFAARELVAGDWKVIDLPRPPAQ